MICDVCAKALDRNRQAKQTFGTLAAASWLSNKQLCCLARKILVRVETNRDNAFNH